MTIPPERIVRVAVLVEAFAVGVNAAALVVDVTRGQWDMARWSLSWAALNIMVVYALLAVDQWRLGLLAQHAEELRALKANADTAEVLLQKWREAQVMAEVEVAPAMGVKH